MSYSCGDCGRDSGYVCIECGTALCHNHVSVRYDAKAPVFVCTDTCMLGVYDDCMCDLCLGYYPPLS